MLEGFDEAVPNGEGFLETFLLYTINNIVRNKYNYIFYSLSFVITLFLPILSQF